MSLSEQLDKASAQLKRLSVRASAAETDANALKAKNKAALEQKVDAAQAAAKQASDDLKASAKESQGRNHAVVGPGSGQLEVPHCQGSQACRHRPRQI